MSAPRTLFDKIWDSHLVDRQDDGTCLIYIDRHLIHEVTSPQAFEGLRSAGRTVRRPDLTLAVPDHNVPTTTRTDAAGEVLPIDDPQSATQVAALRDNAPQFGFIVSYTEENREETGYQPEPWHLRYVGIEKARERSPHRRRAPRARCSRG